jgi:predicted ferric reductase
MRDVKQAEFDELESLSPWVVAGFLGAMVLGAILALKVVPIFVPGLSTSLAGSEPKAYWYLARASAFVAYSMVAASMVLGLLITNKLARVWPGGPAAVDLHEHFSLLGLGFAMFHALVLLGDRYIGYTLAQVLLPFSGSSYRPFWVGIGQVGLYLLAVVTLSFYVRKPLGRVAWRAIHYASFIVFLLALAHGAFAGSDSSATWTSTYYQITGAAVLFLTIYRLLIRPSSKRPRSAIRPEPAVSSSAPAMPANGNIRPRQVVTQSAGTMPPKAVPAPRRISPGD